MPAAMLVMLASATPTLTMRTGYAVPRGTVPFALDRSASSPTMRSAVINRAAQVCAVPLPIHTSIGYCLPPATTSDGGACFSAVMVLLL